MLREHLIWHPGAWDIVSDASNFFSMILKTKFTF